MSFDMALPHTQRVQAILQDGLEVLPENQELWNLYRAAEPGIGRPRDEDDEVEDDPLLKPDQEQAKPITPQRVLDKLQDAKAELDVIVDVVGMVEAAQFLSVAHVPRRAAIQAMARDRALALAGKRGALRGAAARLRFAAAALRGPAAAEAEYLDQVRQLMGCWHLRRAANGLLGHTVELLPLHIFGEHTATITPSPDGQAGCGEARGLQAVRRELQRRQAAALWRSVHSALAGGGAQDWGLAALAAAAEAEAAGRAAAPGSDAPLPLPLPAFKSCVLGSLQAVASKAQLAGSLGAALRGAVASEGVRSCLAARQDLSVVHEEGGWGGDPHVLHVCLGELEGSVAVDGRGVLLEGPLWPRDVQGRRHVGEAELRAILLQL